MIADFSLNRKDNTNTHFFAELDGNLNDNTNYEIQIQNVTNDNYLKIHNIKEYTSLINSESTLTSYLNLEKNIDENTKLDTSIRLYEDLSKEKNDRYQYIFPDFNFSKNINLDESYNGNFQFLSSGFQKIYETNKYEALINNDFNLFELQNEIGKKNYKKVFMISNYFSNNSSYTIQQILSTLHNYFTTIFQIHALKSNNPQILSKNLGINYYFLNDYISASKNYSIKDSVKIIRIINKYDLKSKGVNFDSSANSLINQLMAEIID